MKKHKQIYMEFFSLSPEERVPCEWCNKAPAADVHHIDRRGMGGDQTGEKDRIENLLGVCRTCHDELDTKPEDNARAALFALDLDNRKNIMRRLMYGG